MALETILYSQGQNGNLGYNYLFQEDHFFGGFLEGTTDNNINHHQESASVHEYWGDYSSSSSAMHMKDQWDPKSSPDDCTGGGGDCERFFLGELVSSHRDMIKAESSPTAAVATTSATAAGRRKRRRTKSGKNKEDLENQRMTHITVERNRRKQMNEYLAVIRSMMPSSYAQRGDQASIVAGAINFVKELEQQLQTLEAKKRANFNGYSPPPQPFGDFFTFPQYSIAPPTDDGGGGGGSATMPKNRPPAMAEIEVTMVESHANLKILSKKRQRQLLKMVAGLQCLWFTILHLNVTTVEQMVLYTLSVKLEDGCQLSTVDEIADAVNFLLFRIEEESLCSN